MRMRLLPAPSPSGRPGGEGAMTWSSFSSSIWPRRMTTKMLPARTSATITTATKAPTILLWRLKMALPRAGGVDVDGAERIVGRAPDEIEQPFAVERNVGEAGERRQQIELFGGE